MILSLGQATIVHIALAMISTSEFGLHTFASPTFGASTHTLLALGPKGTKWTLSFGLLEQTLPSATCCPESLQSNKMHFFFTALLPLLSVLLLELYRNLYSIKPTTEQQHDNYKAYNNVEKFTRGEDAFGGDSSLSEEFTNFIC